MRSWFHLNHLVYRASTGAAARKSREWVHPSIVGHEQGELGRRWERHEGQGCYRALSIFCQLWSLVLCL